VHIKRKFKIWIAHGLPTCEEAVRLVSDRRERVLGLRERIFLQWHLAICRWCARYAQHEHLMHQAAQTLAHDGHNEEATLSVQAKEKMKQKLADATTQ
jgi:hypothetical protein